MDDAKDQVAEIASRLESQTLNAVVSGFSFASAIAWMDVVRALVNVMVQTDRTGPSSLAVTALATTLMSILAYMIISKFSNKVKEPRAQPIYAITR
jgi:hypothetical protein